MLVVQEGEEEEQRVAEEEEEKDDVGELVEVSLNSVVGLTIPKIMKIRGSIMGESVVILINCGAIHSFISAELVERLGLTTIDYGLWDVNWHRTVGQRERNM